MLKFSVVLLNVLALQGCQIGKRSLMAATDLLAAVSTSSFNLVLKRLFLVVGVWKTKIIVGLNISISYKSSGLYLT
jgi:hypothetical protein